jgi:hypothetical protein
MAQNGHGTSCLVDQFSSFPTKPARNTKVSAEKTNVSREKSNEPFLMFSVNSAVKNL